MTEQYNPSLSAERINRLLEEQRTRLHDRLLFGAKQIMQSGYPLGRAGFATKIEQLQQLKMNHERNLQVIQGNSWPGDKVRAQRELLEEDKLEREVFGDA